MKAEAVSGWMLPGSKTSSLVYYPDGPDFPIGNIGDPSTPPEQARAVVEQTFGFSNGPIHHLALAPHEPNKGGSGHNVVCVVNPFVDLHNVQVGDGIIVPRVASFKLCTFVGDCCVLAVEGPDTVGMIHAGRPELMEQPSIIEAFFGLWPDPLDKTKILIGPGITGPHYEYDKADPNDPATCTTRWGGTKGWDPTLALHLQLANAGINITDSKLVYTTGIDPFQMCLLGYPGWASDRWWKRNKQQPSPRNCAVISYYHKDEDDD